MFLKVASCLRFFCLKINNIVKSVLKGLQTSLSADDFALCIRAKSLPLAQRLILLCVNSMQDWVSNNGFKFSTSKTVCMHFCNQRKHFAEPSVLLDKSPIKVVSEAKFLGVIFDRTLSYSSHVNYLKTKYFKAWSRSVYSRACYAYCQGFLPCLFLHFWSIHLHFFQNSSLFFLCWLWLTHGSCVGLQNKIGHPAGCRFPC